MKNSEIEARISEQVHNELYRKILRRRLIDGVTFERLAEEFSYSVRQIKRIVYNSKDLIKDVP